MVHLLRRSIAAAAFACGIFFCPCAARAAVTHVGSDTALSSASAASFSISASQAPISGNKIFLVITFAHNPEVLTITGVTGWSEVKHDDGNGCSIWARTAVGGDTTSLGTLNLTTANTTTQHAVMEWSGVNSTTPLDKTPSCGSSAASVTTVTTTGLTPTQGGTRFISFFGTTSTNRTPYTPQSGWTDSTHDLTNGLADLQYDNTSPIGNTSGQITLSNTGNSGATRWVNFNLAPASQSCNGSLISLGVGC